MELLVDILLLSNGVEGVPEDVLGFRKSIVNKPKIDFEQDIITIHVKKIYPEEVQMINEMIINATQMGYVLKNN